MEIPKWFIPPYNMEGDCTNLDTFLQVEFIEMFDLEVKTMNTLKENKYFWMNEKCSKNIASFLQQLSKHSHWSCG